MLQKIGPKFLLGRFCSGSTISHCICITKTRVMTQTMHSQKVISVLFARLKQILVSLQKWPPNDSKACLQVPCVLLKSIDWRRSFTSSLPGFWKSRRFILGLLINLLPLSGSRISQLKTCLKTFLNYQRHHSGQFKLYKCSKTTTTNSASKHLN